VKHSPVYEQKRNVCYLYFAATHLPITITGRLIPLSS